MTVCLSTLVCVQSCQRGEWEWTPLGVLQQVSPRWSLSPHDVPGQTGWKELPKSSRVPADHQLHQPAGSQGWDGLQQPLGLLVSTAINTHTYSGRDIYSQNVIFIFSKLIIFIFRFVLSAFIGTRPEVGDRHTNIVKTSSTSSSYNKMLFSLWCITIKFYFWYFESILLITSDVLLLK